MRVYPTALRALHRCNLASPLRTIERIAAVREDDLAASGDGGTRADSNHDAGALKL